MININIINMTEPLDAVQNWLKENKLVVQVNDEIICTAFVQANDEIIWTALVQDRADIFVWL